MANPRRMRSHRSAGAAKVATDLAPASPACMFVSRPLGTTGARNPNEGDGFSVTASDVGAGLGNAGSVGGGGNEVAQPASTMAASAGIQRPGLNRFRHDTKPDADTFMRVTGTRFSIRAGRQTLPHRPAPTGNAIAQRAPRQADARAEMG